MISQKINPKILSCSLSFSLVIFGGCEESLPLVESELADTWYSDKGISKSDETMWIFRAWNFVYSTDELDRYGNFKSEALDYRKQFSGVVIKRTEKNGNRVGNAHLGVWVLDKDFTKPTVNILWLSGQNGSSELDRAHFALDNKGVRNLIHNNFTYRNSGSNRTMAESLILFAIIGAIIGGFFQFFYINRKSPDNESLKKPKEKIKKTQSNKKIVNSKPKREAGFKLKIDGKKKKPEGFFLKKDEFVKNK